MHTHLQKGCSLAACSVGFVLSIKIESSLANLWAVPLKTQPLAIRTNFSTESLRSKRRIQLISFEIVKNHMLSCASECTIDRYIDRQVNVSSR